MLQTATDGIRIAEPPCFSTVSLPSSRSKAVMGRSSRVDSMASRRRRKREAGRERGLPWPYCSDNGVPFAGPNALFNLSKLLASWLRLRIEIELIRPGQPQQNGRHERMHLTLQKVAICSPG